MLSNKIFLKKKMTSKFIKEDALEIQKQLLENILISQQ